MPEDRSAHDTDKLSFDDFAGDFGKSSDELLDDLKGYNQSLEGAQQISDRAIEMMRSEGISLRRRLTRDWLAGYVRRARITARDHSFADTAVLVKGLETKGANVTATNMPADEIVYEDLQEFGVAVTEFQTKNDLVEKSRSDLCGHYLLARETTRDGEHYYYEEPVFIGKPHEKSYMLTMQGTVATGFVVPSNGMMTLVLNHYHSLRGIGTITIMAGLSTDNATSYSTGVMLRLSDSQARPVASRVVLRKVTDAAQIEEWEVVARAAEALKPKHVRKLVRKLEEGEDLQTKYRALETGHFLKTPDLSRWDSMVEDAGLPEDEDD